MEVVDTLENINYTFSITDDDDDPFTWTNLIIKKRESGDIDSPFLLKYVVDSNYTDAFVASGFSMKYFTGIVSKRYFNFNQNSDGYSANLENTRATINESCGGDTFLEGSGGPNGSTSSSDPGGTLAGLAIPTDCVATVIGYEPNTGPKFRPWDFVWSNMYPYGGDPIIAWICSDTYSFDMNTSCPGSESEEIGVLFNEFDEYIDNLSLHSIYSTVDADLLPEWLWQQGYLNPYLAGFIDGIWETIDSTWGVVEWVGAVSGIDNSPEAEELKKQTWQFIRFLNDLANSSYARQQTWNSIKESFLQYIDETVAFTPQAQYNQGKLIFDVGSMFVGVGAFKLALKGDDLITNLIRVLKILPTEATKSIVNAKDIGLDAIKEVGQVIIKSPAGGDDIARFSEFATTVSKHQILAKKGSVVFKKADDVNAGFPLHYDPPYHNDYAVTEFLTTQDENFVRVFKDGGSKQSAWIVKQSEIEGLTPSQIKDKLALDNVPDMIVELTVPSNFPLRTGRIAPRPNGTSGGKIQFQLLQNLNDSYWGTPRGL